MTNCTVGIIGVGAMGEALVSGLLAAGWEPSDIRIGVRRKERAEELEQRLGCPAFFHPVEVVDGRQLAVVAVKPRDVPGVLEALAGRLEAGQALLSLAAGVTTSTYEAALGDVPVIRAMPNTPALVGFGVTAIAPGKYAEAGHVELARQVLGAVGTVRELDETLMNAVTAVSGTGPAYVFLLAEAMTEAAVREGLPRDIAESFVAQTIRGAGHLLTDTLKSSAELRYEVTSPGGTTAAAMHILEARGFRALVEDAVRAASARSAELGTAGREGSAGGPG